MKKGVTVARILLGIMLVVFGLNGFLNFIPMPEMPEAAGKFMGALVESGYMMPLVKSLEILIGIGLLINWKTPLLVILLAPIMLNAFLFHLFLDVAGIGGSLLALVLNAFLIYSYRDYYFPMVQKAQLSS